MCRWSTRYCWTAILGPNCMRRFFPKKSYRSLRYVLALANNYWREHPSARLLSMLVMTLTQGLFLSKSDKRLACADRLQGIEVQLPGLPGLAEPCPVSWR